MHIFHVQVEREVKVISFFSANFQAIDYFSKFKWDWIY